jgi:Tol biopolymer transport system component
MVVLTGLLLAALSLAACGDGDTSQPTPTRTPEATRASLVPIPTVVQTPVELSVPMLLPERDPITQDGGYLADVRAGQLWRLPGWGGIWSPDSRTLLATGCCLGDGGLDLITVPAGPVVRIFDGDVAAAAWSPHGSQIAFSPYTDGPKGLYIVNRDGSGLSELADKVRPWVIKWSPSGDHIAFGDGEAAVYLLSASGGEAELMDNFSDFAWSPMGDILALGGDDGLYLLDADSSDRQRLAPGPTDGPLLWSPDGSRLVLHWGERAPLTFGAYAGTPEAGVRRLHVIDVDDPGEPAPLALGRNASWSRDGSRIAYLSEGCITDDWNIYKALPDGRSEAQLTNTPAAAKEGPAWSPVTSAIAYSTFDELITVDADSGEARTIAVPDLHSGSGLHVHGADWGSSPWSPDGRYLLFQAGGNHGICD